MADALPRIVLDTNVLVSAIRSRRGASFKLLSLVGRGRFLSCVSVPLVLEYEDAMKRFAASFGMTDDDVATIIDYMCAESDQRAIYFLMAAVPPRPEGRFRPRAGGRGRGGMDRHAQPS